MKNYNLLIIWLTILILLCSCSSYKKGLTEIGNENDAIMNAIVDFSNTTKIFKKYTVFSVHLVNLNKDKIAVSIGEKNLKILLTSNVRVGSKGYAPSRYFEKNGKLFVWWDDNYPLTKEALSTYNNYGITQDDQGGLIQFPEHEIDDSKKGVDYYFCRNNLLEYKKVTTKIGLGYYEPPKLNCK